MRRYIPAILLCAIYVAGWGIIQLMAEYRIGLRERRIQELRQEVTDLRSDLQTEKNGRDIEAGRIYIICERAPLACENIE